MAIAKQNKLSIILACVLVGFVLVVILVKMAGGEGVGSKKGIADNQTDADTRGESLASLSAQLEEMKSELATARSESKNLVENALKSSASDGTSLVNRVTRAQEGVVKKLETEIASLKNNVDALTNTKDSPQYPISENTKNVGPDGYVWSSGGATLPATSDAKSSTVVDSVNSLINKAGGTPIKSALNLNGTRDSEATRLPAYTIPANATLMGSRGMTAVIGRVPVGGSVTNAFPFKVVTGKQALTANGMELPEVQRAIWTGVAAGDATLKCASGAILSVTFIFADGTIHTVGDPNVTGTAQTGKVLGYISNDRGFQCIPGKFVSNAGKVAKDLFLAGAATGYANAFARSQLNTTVNGAGITDVFTGDTNDFALSNGAANGFSRWAAYVEERARDLFDAVVLQPGHGIVIHTTKEIPIDYNTNGRKLRHVQNVNNQNLGVD